MIEPELLEESEENDDEVELDSGLELSDLDPSVDLLSFPSDLEGDEAVLPAVRLVASPIMRDALNAYIQAISKFPLIHPDEEQELARRALNNDQEAAFRLISAHLRLVVKIAMEFQRRWMQNVLDLIQEGNVGLIRAVNKFDPEKGIKFSYYASFWIKAFILKFIMDNWRMVKIGTTQAQRKLFYNLNREKQKLIALGFNPDSEMLAKHLNVSKEEIVDMEQRLDSQDSSLDLTVSQDGEGASRIDFLPALGPGVEDSIATHEISLIIRDKLSDILPFLSEKEVCILNERLLSDDPVTLREIGERYNITRERVRQIETRLLQKLKEFLTKDIQDFSESWIVE
nr:RNA polymerase factor sigma-32 [Desulfovibrio litoralis]